MGIVRVLVAEKKKMERRGIEKEGGRSRKKGSWRKGKCWEGVRREWWKL